MPSDSTLIDRIVHEVLRTLGSSAECVGAPVEAAPETASGRRQTVPQAIVLEEAVITGALLEAKATPAAIVHIGERAVLTPSARDAVRSLQLKMVRGLSATGGINIDRMHSAESTSAEKTVAAMPSRQVSDCVVVDSTPALEQLLQDYAVAAVRLTCPDEAVVQITHRITDRAEERLAVFTTAAHRVAMLSNRQEAVRAVAVDDVPMVRSIQKQCRPNVWCIDPRRKSYFELRQLLRTAGLFAPHGEGHGART